MIDDAPSSEAISVLSSDVSQAHRDSGLGLGASERRGKERWLTVSDFGARVPGVGLGAARLRLYEATPVRAIETKIMDRQSLRTEAVRISL